MGKEEEGVTPEVKGVEPKVEGGKPTQPEATSIEPKAEPTIRTFTEEEFQKAVSKGVEALTRQLSLRDNEIKRLKSDITTAQATQTQWEDDLKDREAIIEKLATEKFAEDSEVLSGFRNKTMIDLEKKRFERQKAQRERELEQKEAEIKGLTWAIEMSKVATELMGKYQVPKQVLDICRSEEEMKIVAEQFPEVKAKEPEPKTPPKFDSTVPSGGGSDWSKSSIADKITEGIRRDAIKRQKQA